MAQSIENPLNMAFVGDAVYSLYIRHRLALLSGAHVGTLHRAASRMVCAEAQYRAAAMLMPILEEDEVRIFKWGRNTKSATVPKNADVVHYRHATGLEALVGSLYTNGKTERLEFLMGKVFDFLYDEN